MVVDKWGLTILHTSTLSKVTEHSGMYSDHISDWLLVILQHRYLRQLLALRVQPKQKSWTEACSLWFGSFIMDTLPSSTNETDLNHNIKQTSSEHSKI